MPGDPDAIALLFTGAQQSGNWEVLSTGLSGGRYVPLDHLAAGARGLVSRVSSATIFPPSTGGQTSLLLFAGGFIGKGTHSNWEGPYQSDFLQLTNWTTGEWDVDMFDYGFKFTDWDNVATHFMVIRTNSSQEIRASVRQLFQPNINQFLGTLPSGVTVTSQVVSWDPFPQGKQFLSPNQIYIRLNFRFNIDVPNWPSDYQARVTYWIRLWVANGRINGNVQRWEWWSSGGVWAKVIGAIIGPNTELGAIRINQSLAGVLNSIQLPFTPNEVFYLPSTQQFISTELVSHTFNDVTIVVT